MLARCNSLFVDGSLVHMSLTSVQHFAKFHHLWVDCMTTFFLQFLSKFIYLCIESKKEIRLVKKIMTWLPHLRFEGVTYNVSP